MTRFELVTSSLPRKRSTPELHRLDLQPFCVKPKRCIAQANTLQQIASLLLKSSKNNNLSKVVLKSGRRGSNSRHSAWKADALPTELLPLVLFSILRINFNGRQNYDLIFKNQI